MSCSRTLPRWPRKKKQRKKQRKKKEPRSREAVARWTYWWSSKNTSLWKTSLCWMFHIIKSNKIFSAHVLWYISFDLWKLYWNNVSQASRRLILCSFLVIEVAWKGMNRIKINQPHLQWYHNKIAPYLYKKRNPTRQRTWTRISLFHLFHWTLTSHRSSIPSIHVIPSCIQYEIGTFLYLCRIDSFSPQ